MKVLRPPVVWTDSLSPDHHLFNSVKYFVGKAFEVYLELRVVQMDITYATSASEKSELEGEECLQLCFRFR